jgi:hypothetical protein
MFTERYELSLYIRTYVRLISVFNSLACNGSGGQSPASHSEGQSSIPGESTSVSWLSKWQWNRVVSENFCFPLSVSLHERSTLVFMCMLLLPEGQRTEACEPSKKQWSFGNRGTLDWKVLSLCSLHMDKSREIFKRRHVYKLQPTHTLQSVSEIKNITAIRISKMLVVNLAAMTS